MPKNLRWVTSDPAQSIADLEGRVNSLQGQYGYIGPGATLDSPNMTSPTAQTLTVNDDNGNTLLTIDQAGISLSAGTFWANQIVWNDSSGGMIAQIVTGPTSLSLSSVFDTLNLDSSGVNAHVGSGIAILCNGTGSGLWGGSLLVFGNVTATAFITSDRQIKDDIRSLNRNDLLKLHDLRPVTYRSTHDGRVTHGLVAQEVEDVFPSIVKEDEFITGLAAQQPEEGEPVYDTVRLKSVESMPLIAMLIAEVQDLRKRVSELESRVP